MARVAVVEEESILLAARVDAKSVTMQAIVGEEVTGTLIQMGIGGHPPIPLAQNSFSC